MARHKTPNVVIFPTNKRKAALNRRTRKYTAARFNRIERNTQEKEIS